MQELENNALFWQKIDSLVASCSVVVKWKKGEPHPDIADAVFPLDSGVIKNDDQDLAQFYKGSCGNKVDGLIIITDILDKQIRNIFLIGTNQEEQNEILHFIGGFDYKNGILVRRGYDVPDWESNND